MTRTATTRVEADELSVAAAPPCLPHRLTCSTDGTGRPGSLPRMSPMGDANTPQAYHLLRPPEPHQQVVPGPIRAPCRAAAEGTTACDVSLAGAAARAERLSRGPLWRSSWHEHPESQQAPCLLVLRKRRGRCCRWQLDWATLLLCLTIGLNLPAAIEAAGSPPPGGPVASGQYQSVMQQVAASYNVSTDAAAAKAWFQDPAPTDANGCSVVVVSLLCFADRVSGKLHRV